MKVVLRCTTVDSGVGCAVPHRLLQLMRPLQSVETWGTTIWSAEPQPTMGIYLVQPTSLALAVRAV